MPEKLLLRLEIGKVFSYTLFSGFLFVEY